MGKQIGRNFLATYQAPLLVLGILGVALAVDSHFKGADADAYARGQSQLSSRKYENPSRTRSP